MIRFGPYLVKAEEIESIAAKTSENPGYPYRAEVRTKGGALYRLDYSSEKDRDQDCRRMGQEAEQKCKGILDVGLDRISGISKQLDRMEKRQMRIQKLLKMKDE